MLVPRFRICISNVTRLACCQLSTLVWYGIQVGVRERMWTSATARPTLFLHPSNVSLIHGNIVWLTRPDFNRFTMKPPVDGWVWPDWRLVDGLNISTIADTDPSAGVCLLHLNIGTQIESSN